MTSEQENPKSSSIYAAEQEVGAGTTARRGMTLETSLSQTTTFSHTSHRKMFTAYSPPPLHRVFGTQLQGRGKGEKAGGGPKDCYGLHQDYPTMRTKVVGYGKPGRLSTRVYGKADFHIPALGVWRPLDKTYRPMGELFAARKTLQKVGRCSKQTPAVYAPRSRKAKLCVSTQIGSRPHTAAFICFAAE